MMEECAGRLLVVVDPAGHHDIALSRCGVVISLRHSAQCHPRLAVDIARSLRHLADDLERTGSSRVVDG